MAKFSGRDTGLSLTSRHALAVHNQLSLSVEWAIKGVSLKISFLRGTMKFTLPILLGPLGFTSFSTLCLSGLTPLLVTTFVAQILRPWQEQEAAVEIERVKLAKHNDLLQLEHLATTQQELMQSVVLVKKKNAVTFRILKATYGRNAIVWDVTTPLWFFVKVRNQDVTKESINEFEIGRCSDVTIGF